MCGKLMRVGRRIESAVESLSRILGKKKEFFNQTRIDMAEALVKFYMSTTWWSCRPVDFHRVKT